MKLKIKDVTTTIATVMTLVSLTSSVGFVSSDINNVDLPIAGLNVKSNQTHNLNSTLLCDNNNSSLLGGSQIPKKNKVKIESLSNDLFGKMRYLTPEENESKNKKYIEISETVEGANFFDLLWLRNL